MWSTSAGWREFGMQPSSRSIVIEGANFVLGPSFGPQTLPRLWWHRLGNTKSLQIRRMEEGHREDCMGRTRGGSTRESARWEREGAVGTVTSIHLSLCRLLSQPSGYSGIKMQCHNARSTDRLRRLLVLCDTAAAAKVVRIGFIVPASPKRRPVAISAWTLTGGLNTTGVPLAGREVQTDEWDCQVMM